MVNAKKIKFLLKIAYILFLFFSTIYAEWSPQHSGVSKNLNSVKFVDSSNGIIVGKTGVILRTRDGGLSWDAIDSGTRNSLNEVFFINKSTGWICGEGGTILKTLDGGETWIAQVSGTSLNLEAVFFYDSLHGWAVGEAQRIVATENGGASWSIETFSPYDESVAFRSVHFVAPNSGWIVGDGATIIRELSGTSGWVSADIASISEFTRFNAVHFIDRDTGWIVGRKASLVFSKLEMLKTVNSGASWQITYPDADGAMGLESLSDIQFVDESLAWAVGQDGKIINTTTGGGNWTLQKSGVTTTLNALSFVDKNNGWIVGDGGVILHTSNGGTVGSKVGEKNSIQTFSLRQNYPNPFNASTFIEFELQHPSFVNLSIFALSGECAAIPAHGRFPAGLHRIQFDANELPSGVYIYKCNAGNVAEQKRMLLLR